MNGFSLFVWLALAQTPSLQVATLSGEQNQGTIEAFTPESLVIRTDAKSVKIPIAEILSIQSTHQAAASAQDAAIEVRFVDSTLLRVQSVSASASVMTFGHSRLGTLKIPTTSISSIRFAPQDAKVDAEWNRLLERSIKKDVVAVRKGDILDHLDGVIGTLNDVTMQFQMDGEDIGVKREKVFGLIFSKRDSLAKKSIAQLDLVTGDRLALKQISWNGTAWQARLVTGLELEIPSELFHTLDYSLGKVVYLSDMEPRTAKLTPYWGIEPAGSFAVNEYRRDKSFDGTRISLGEKSYAKGLGIHSKTLMKYRLGGEFRRFQAVMGIGDEIPMGDVDVVLKGDNKTLFKGSAKASEPGERGLVQRAVPQILDIDVTGVVELEILVDFGSDKRDIGDRLYLANARVTK